MTGTTILSSFKAWMVTLISEVPPGMWCCFLFALWQAGGWVVSFPEAFSWPFSRSSFYSMDQGTNVGTLPVATYVSSMGPLELL